MFSALCSGVQHNQTTIDCKNWGSSFLKMYGYSIYVKYVYCSTFCAPACRFLPTKSTSIETLTLNMHVLTYLLTYIDKLSDRRHWRDQTSSMHCQSPLQDQLQTLSRRFWCTFFIYSHRTAYTTFLTAPCSSSLKLISTEVVVNHCRL